jgi:hypothetical protein
VVAASFGLLHGFGFAAVLREIGLPTEGLVTALLAFNLGIEAGQAVFATALMGLIVLVGRFGNLGHGIAAQRLAGYAVGIDRELLDDRAAGGVALGPTGSFRAQGGRSSAEPGNTSRTLRGLRHAVGDRLIEVAFGEALASE